MNELREWRDYAESVTFHTPTNQYEYDGLIQCEEQYEQEMMELEANTLCDYYHFSQTEQQFVDRYFL